MKLRMIQPAFQETAHENIGDFAEQKETEKISKIFEGSSNITNGRESNQTFNIFYIAQHMCVCAIVEKK